MKYTVLSLFPEIPDAYAASSIMAKAVAQGLIEYRSVNIRDFALDKHKTCDDAPYGGGPGMLMLAEPLARALEAAGAVRKPVRNPVEPAPCGAQKTAETPETPRRPLEKKAGPRVIYLSPSGVPLNQDLAGELAAEQELILVCGRYEGIDQRIIDLYVDDELSIGDYVLSSGEAAAIVLMDATYRLVEGVISPLSLDEETFSDCLLEYPQYTRPEIYATLKTPEILLSGHHENIRLWRLRKRVEKTLALRPDLIRKGEKQGRYNAETVKLIEELRGIYERDTGRTSGADEEQS